MVAHACNPNTKAVAKEFLWVQNQPEQLSKGLSQNKKCKGWRCSLVAQHPDLIPGATKQNKYSKSRTYIQVGSFQKNACHITNIRRCEKTVDTAHVSARHCHG